MTRMAGSVGLSLAVRLHGYTGIGQLAPNIPPGPSYPYGSGSSSKSRREPPAGHRYAGPSMATTILAAALVILAAGAIIAGIALVSAGIRREERRFTMTRQAPDRVSERTRRLTGLYVRDMVRVPGLDRETTLV
jgi:hypothetical protein